MSGAVIMRIYTLSGDLVDEMDQGVQTGGSTYYASWDGKNKDGDAVASGVYFLVIEIAGKNVKDKIIKLAVIK
jgi:flagellar hook assembly protein FlgD